MLISICLSILFPFCAFAASDTPSDGVVVSVTVDRDSGITPVGVFSGVNGMDNQSYSITPLYKDWSEAWQYRWSEWTTSASLFGFKSFSAYITIPVNISVPRSSKTTLFIPGFYIVVNGIINSSSDVPFSNVTFQNDKGDIQTVNLIPSITDTNSIIAFDDTSVELGEGSWTVTNIILRCQISPTVFTSANGYLGLSGFEFSMTTSLSVSDFISQQTQDIIKNDVLPAVENMNQSLNDVNSSVEDVNQSLQAVNESVKQGNQKLTQLNNAVNNLPSNVVSALDQKAKQETDEYVDKVNENSDAVMQEIEKILPLTSFRQSLNTLAMAFSNESRTNTLKLPQAKLPESLGGAVLWEEQDFPIATVFDKIPVVLVYISQGVFTAALMWGALMYLYRLITSYIGGGSDE